MTKLISPLVSQEIGLLPVLLRKAINYAGTYSPYYFQLFSQLGLKPGSIMTYTDFRQIPCTTKEDIAKDYRKFICVSDEQIIDRSCTSGTTSTPTPFVLTDSDLNRLTRNEAASLTLAGIGSQDTVMLCCTMDQRFMAGLAYFLGLRQIGASVIRQGVCNLLSQWDCIRREEPTAIICVPSFLLRLIHFAKENGIDYRSSSLRKVICIGESIRQPDFSLNELGRRLKEAWPELSLHSTYASTEIGAAFTECSEGQGGHQNPELTHIEVLDQVGFPVTTGEIGELVVTTLGVEGMPLIRFRTGDLVQLHNQACACGRTTPRLSPVIGRKNQMLKVKGTTIYPPAIHDSLNSVAELENYVIEVFTNESGQDDLRIYFTTVAGVNDLELQVHLKEICHARLRLKPTFFEVSKKEMYRMQFPSGGRKPRKFIDYRK